MMNSMQKVLTHKLIVFLMYYVIDIDIGDIGEIEESAVTDEANYYKENIFNKEDYYLFRAVMYFYAEEYQKAILDYKQTSKI